MNNYEYILASFPYPSPASEAPDTETLLAFVRGQLSDKDAEAMDILTDGFDGTKLNADYYARALKSHCAFVRNFLLYDLQLRNTKAEYLNAALGRAEGTDILPVPGLEDAVFEEKPEVLSVLRMDDIIARERGLDDLLWNKAEELTRLNILDLDVVLATVAKIMITERWNKLDPAAGRELFRQLVQEIRNTR